MITLRKVTMKDADMLLKWKNDPVMRKFSIWSHGRIQKTPHLAWLKSKLADQRCRFTIILSGKTPIGVLRIEGDGEVSIMLDPKSRGMGIGAYVVRTFCSPAAGKLYAKIVNGNVASLRVFTQNWFAVSDYSKDGYYILKNY